MFPFAGKGSLIRPEEVSDLARRFRSDREAYEWVRDSIEYRPELRTDIWQSPRVTLELGTADCEDAAILCASILEARGTRARLNYGVAGPPSAAAPMFHVWCEAGKDWHVYDPALALEFPRPELPLRGYFEILHIYPDREVPAPIDNLFCLAEELF
ncbi:MAG: transglutaminase domain-containing protein [Deltaproteobacteria bacterium]|nr:transglutaminase domain-containing protein [Deltaproteobacteria bacterium]MBW2672947.1 transglutaminase domain-containing protein [Deltaproteobacteria bacterium]